MSWPLNVLCQSPVSVGMSPNTAIHNTVELAIRCEELGYHRFWVAEHHSDAALASPSPEILIAHIAAKTQTIRVGSGGILLPFYSPFKVAEVFRTLSCLYPDRVDLGVGRATGSEGHAPQALGVRTTSSFQAFEELLFWLTDANNRPFPDTFAGPNAVPEPWVLGTSPRSAAFAGTHGLPYAFGGFLDPRALVPSLTAYHQAFRPSRWRERPYVNLGWYVQAADTEAEAHALTRSSEHWFVESFVRGKNPQFEDPDTLKARYTPMEQMAIAMRREYALVGTGEQVLAGLEKLSTQLAVDEFTLVTIPFRHADRVHSYELIAAAR